MAATSCLLYFMAANSVVGVCGQLLPPAQFHYKTSNNIYLVILFIKN